MSFAKVLGAFALAGLGGFGLLAADYVGQWSKADSGFGGPHYVETLIDRFGERGGPVGLLLRKSATVAAARPPAPAGWIAEARRADHDSLLFSPAQLLALNHELSRARMGLPDLRQLSRIDLAAHHAYVSDTSIAYRNDKGVIALSIQDPARRIAHPVWQAYETSVKAHFDRIDTLIEHDTVQGLTWYEVHGPVELADNGQHPDRLRSFQARLGEIDLYLTTRAPDHHIERFLNTVDLDALRALAQDRPTSGPTKLPLPELARATQSPDASPPVFRANRGLD